MVLKVIKLFYIIFILIDLSDNIFRAFIDKDNKNIIILMKKVFYIYSKNLRIKKLYYFMKFYKITEILKSKDIKSNKYLNNGRKTYNNLYNDYTLRNRKKENMEINQLYNESELYPFSPLINHSGYITIEPHNFTPYANRYNSYNKYNPLVKLRANLNEPFPNGRNILTENTLFNKQNYNNNYLNKNDVFQKHQNDYLNNNKKSKYEDSKNNYLNNTDYRFYSPINRHKKKKNNIYSNRNDDINSKISEYLNHFENNKRRINLINPNSIYNSMNNNDDSYPYKRNKSNNNIGHGNKFNIKGKGNPPFLNNNEISYDITSKRNKEIDNYFNKRNNNKKDNKNNNKDFIFNKDSFSFKKNQNNQKPILFNNNYAQNKNDKNNKKLYNESKEYFYSFNQENNKNNNKDLIKKNSNTSLIPSSLGNEYTKTYYTNKQKNSNNNFNIGNSNINSASSRAMDTHYHFLNGLKMASGEVNEYFYDFHSKRGNKDKNDDQKSVQSLQSLSDSKMLELANHYLSEEDDSVENYQMNNILYNKKKYIIK